jgi:MscS family membrane protein
MQQKSPRQLFGLVSFLVLLAILVAPSAAQVPRPGAPQATPAPAADVADPLGRRTPRGTISGFLAAVRREDFVAAEAYLQLTAAQRSSAARLARDLAALTDRYFSEPIASLSAAPTGALDDDLPVDRDRIRLSVQGERVDLLLVHVTDPGAGPIWLISSDALAQVPALRSSLEPSWIDRNLPEALSNHSLFGVSFSNWLVWLASIMGSLLAMRGLSSLLWTAAARSVPNPTRRKLVESWRAELTAPGVIAAALFLHLVTLPLLGLPLQFRLGYVRYARVVVAFAFAWLTWRFLTLSFTQARVVALRRGQAGTRSLMLLGERVVKVGLVLMTIFALLAIAGVDMTTALAGVGIGGVALAFGAQKTVENLLGGVFLLTDRAIAVGDFCTISDRQGWIEDITLRSVRLRTVQQTLLSIPAGSLSQANVENFATRQKMLIQNLVRLRYGTTVDQVQGILDRIRELLSGHSMIEAETSRIRLVNLSADAVELELFAYVVTSDNNQFMAIRESLLLAIAAIVESSGSGFAIPRVMMSADPAATPTSTARIG